VTSRTLVTATRLRIAVLCIAGAVPAGLTLLQLVGLPVFWAMAIAVLPWALALWLRNGLATAMSISLMSVLWVSLVALFAAPHFRVPLIPLFTAIAFLAAVGGVAFFARTWVNRDGVAHRGLTSLGILAGPIVWWASLAQAHTFSAGPRLSWAMSNDSPNYIILARAVLSRPGFDRGPTSNPVPLPSGIVALAAVSGRESTPPGDLLMHDVSAYADIWAVLIALTCAMSGLLALTITRRISDRNLPALISGVVGSALPLTWFVTGYALEYGFFNADVALPLLFASILLYLDTRIKFAWKAFWLTICVTLMLAVWSPLVLVPLGLLLSTALINFQSLRQLRRIDYVLVVLGCAQAGAYALAVVVPAFLGQRTALAGAGGIYELPTAVVFVAGVAVVVASAVAFRADGIEKTHGRQRLLGMTAVVLSGWLGIGALLFLSRKSANPWGYYPLKYSWLMTVVFFILIVGLLAGLVGRSTRTRLMSGLGLGLIAVLAASLLAWLPSSTPKYTPLDPVSRVLGLRLDQKNRQAAFNEAVLSLSDPEVPRILWRSSLSADEEGAANIWFTLFRSNSLDSSDLRIIGLQANAIRTLPVLCSMADLMGPGTEIITADPTLQSKFRTECLGSTATIRVDTSKF